MLDVRETDTYATWFSRLQDERAKARINARLFRLMHGNPGDIKPVGGGISELRIDYGPGYRIYLMRLGNIVVLLLCGGDKSTQSADIAKAKRLAELAKEQDL